MYKFGRTNTEEFPKGGYFDEHFFLRPREQVVPSDDLGKRITWNRYLGVYSSGPQLDMVHYTSILPHGPYNTGLLLLRNSARSGSTGGEDFLYRAVQRGNCFVRVASGWSSHSGYQY